MLGVSQSRGHKLFGREIKLFSKNSNLCVHGTWSLQTDGQTDRRLTVASPRSVLASRGKNTNYFSSSTPGRRILCSKPPRNFVQTTRAWNLSSLAKLLLRELLPMQWSYFSMMYRLRWYCWAILSGGRFSELRPIYQGCRPLTFALARLSCWNQAI